MSFLLVMSIVAYLTRTQKNISDKKQITWVSDPNPQRYKQIEEFNRVNPDLELLLDPDNTGVTKVTVQCAAGVGPDLIGHVLPGSTQQLYLDTGCLMDLTDIGSRHGFGIETLPEQVRDIILAQNYDEKTDSLVKKQYIYPAGVSHYFLIYNKNLFDKYKLPYPHNDMTWDEFVELAKKATIRKSPDAIPEVYGFGPRMTPIIFFMYDTDTLNTSGTRSQMGTPEFIAAAKEYHKIFYGHKIAPTPDERTSMATMGGWAGGSDMNHLSANKIAVIVGARWMLIQIRRYQSLQKKARAEFLKANPGKEDEAPEVLRLGACLMPIGPSGKRVTLATVRGVGINAKTGKPEEAYKFMQYLASADFARIVNAGPDAKAGPMKYNTVELSLDPDYPGEEEVIRTEIESIKYGRKANMSLLIPASIPTRIMKRLTDTVEAGPMSEQEIENLCKRLSDELDTALVRAVKREPIKRKIYNKLLEAGAPPLKYPVD